MTKDFEIWLDKETDNNDDFIECADEAQLTKAVLIYKKCLTSDKWDVNVDIDYNILEV